MSAIDELLKELDEHYSDPLGMIPAARSELAQLRATVAEQARQLESSIDVLQRIANTTGRNGHTATNIVALARAWLAAHAPAPQAEQEHDPTCPLFGAAPAPDDDNQPVSAFAAIEKLMADRPDLFAPQPGDGNEAQP